MNIQELLELTVKNNASDLHLAPGVPPTLRVHGKLERITSQSPLDKERAKELVFGVLTDQQKEEFVEKREMDFSYSIPSGVRFRVNVYYTKGMPAAAFRAIPLKIPSIEDLHLPKILHQFTNWRQGFVLVTGPTGHGKSTTVASILEEINANRSEHIVSLEDPVEYVLEPEESIISQREVGKDSLNWKTGLRSVLREDPDVVFVGEMRDLESIQLALTIAETGHLVFSTLHTNSAAQTIDRIIDVFPEETKEQVRLQLASVLAAVVSQRLVPTVDDKRVPAVELLMANQAVRTSIRESKTHMIDNIIQTSREEGMIPLELSLANWVNQGKVEQKVAESYALRPKELNRQLRSLKTS
jgi:twitching motility protein PilT